MRPRLLCLHGLNSPGPWDLLTAIEPIADLVVVVSGTDETASSAREIFESLDVAVYDDPDAAQAAEVTVDGVITYSEPQIPVAAELAHRWGLPGFSPNTARVLRSKLAQRRRLAESRCDDVAHLSARTADDVRRAAFLLGLPVVLKPDRGWGSREVRSIHTPAAVEEAARGVDPAEAGGYLVERLLQGRNEPSFGDYVSVEVVMADGRPVVLAVTGKLPLLPPFREPGQFWPSHLPAAEKAEVCEFVLRAVRALGIEVGALHVEVKLCPDGPHILELNGRLGGFIPELFRPAGVDLIALAALAALGRAPTAAVLDEREPIEIGWVRFQHSSLVPPGVVEFVDAPSAKTLSRREQVDFYRLLAKPHQRFGNSVATGELDLVQAVIADHDTMPAAIDELCRQTVLRFRDAEGDLVTLTGDRITQLNLASAATAR